MFGVPVERLAEVTGLNPQLLRNWITDGVVKPARRGSRGRGCEHRFSLTQAVGIVVATGLQRTERGCTLSYVALVVEAFANVSEEWLEERFAGKCTHFLAVQAGRPVLTGHRYGDQIDVKAAHRAIAGAVAKELAAAQ